MYPRAAREFTAVAGRSSAYYGGEWGFRYYFDRAGFTQMPPNGERLPSGSLLLRPRLALPYKISRSALRASKLLHRRTYKPKNPLRLLDNESTAGFYSTYWGKLPFALSWKDLETIEFRQFGNPADSSAPASLGEMKK